MKCNFAPSPFSDLQLVQKSGGLVGNVEKEATTTPIIHTLIELDEATF